MTPRRKTQLVATAVMVASLAGSIALLRPLRGAQQHSESDDVLFIPSAKALRAFSLGYTGLMADIYWTRAVQHFGRRHTENNATYPLLYGLLDLTTELDPKLVVAYQFGGMFLAPAPPNGAGQPDKAVELVERGIRTNPNEWRLYFTLGFIHYLERHDLQAARDAFERGSQIPNSHPMLRVLAATVAQQGGEEQKAQMLWRAIYDTTEDAHIKDNALKHLVALQVDQEVPRLEALVSEFNKKLGRPPSNFAEMVAAGWLKALPKDPTGTPYQLTTDGRVEVGDPDRVPYVTKGLPVGYSGKKSGIAAPTAQTSSPEMNK